MSNPTDKDELREKLYEYNYPNTTQSIRLTDAHVEHILRLFDHYADQRVRESQEALFQKMIPDEGVDESTKGTFADGYTTAVEDICNNYYSVTLKESK